MRPELIVGLGFGLALAPPALVVQAQTLNELFEAGNAAQAAGDYAEAERIFREVIRQQPENSGAYNNLGNALRDQGDVAGAIAAYERAIQLDPDHAFAYNGLGNALRDQGDVARAIAAYEQAIERDPTYAVAYNGLGNALKDQGDVVGAIAAYERAIQLNPTYALAYNGLGNMLLNQGDVAGAIAAYERSIELDPDYAFPYNNWGYLLYIQGDYTGAIAKYEAALTIDPNYITAQTNLDQARRDLLLQTTAEPTEQTETAWIPDTASQFQLRAVVRVIVNARSGSGQEGATGWVVKREGDRLWVLTNRHVIEDNNARRLSNSIQVEFYSRPPAGEVRLRRTAQLLHTTDPTDPRDLAVLLITNSPQRVDALDLAPTLADLGTDVDIYGHHTAAYWDLARGFISNNQDGTTIPDGQRLTISQATVSQGSSGSPVLDRATGQVIGMMVEIDQLDPVLGENFVGSLSYAIPSATILEMLSQWGVL